MGRPSRHSYGCSKVVGDDDDHSVASFELSVWDVRADRRDSSTELHGSGAALCLDSTVQGVVVTSVDPSTDAGGKLKRGDVIQAINSTPVRSAAELARGVAAAKAAGRPQVLLLVNRGKGNAGFIPVKIK